MSVVSKDFLASAIKILDRSAGDEIDYRNVISRSYYSIYNAITSSVNPPRNPNKRLSRQAELIEYLCDIDATKNEKMSSIDLRTLGLILEASKKRRFDSDYLLGKGITRIQAETEILQAERFHRILDSQNTQQVTKAR